MNSVWTLDPAIEERVQNGVRNLVDAVRPSQSEFHVVRSLGERNSLAA